MKRKIYFLSMAMVALALVFTSCSKDDENPVTPVDMTPVAVFFGGAEYISQDATLTVGESFKVGVNASENANSKKNIASFKVVRTFNNVNTTVFEELSIGQATYSWESVENANAAVGSERWTFTVTDNGGEVKELSFIITTEAGGYNVVSYPNINMGSYDDTDYGSFFATSTGLAYKKASATTNQAIIDFAFFYGASNGITFGAPANTTVIDVFDLIWGTLNVTLFQESPISAAEFNAIGDTYTFPAFTSTANIINQLHAGDVIYFKTTLDKLGFIKINNTKKDGFEINIDVKVRQ